MQHNYRVIKWRRAANIFGNKEFLTIAPVPHDEQCTPCGYDHLKDGEFECAVFIDQLKRLYGEPPEGCEFFICENDHETGIYHEAAIFYEREDEESDTAEFINEIAVTATSYAMQVENGCDKWDDVALAALKEAEHYLYVGKIIKMKVA